MEVLVLIPLLVILVVMVKRHHMLIAGLAGGVVAMIIGGVGLEDATSIVSAAIPGMVSIITPAIYSTTALVVAKAGGFEALMRLSRKIVGDKEYIIAALIVLIQSLATYAAGLGAGNTMVTGPLAFAILGAHPAVIAGMSLGTAASFMTSPSGADAAAISEISGIPIADYSSAMLVPTIIIWILAMLIAIIGVYRSGSLLAGKEEIVKEELSMKRLLVLSIPPIYFLIVVVAGKQLNGLFNGYNVFSPIFNMISTLFLTALIARIKIDDIAKDLVDNSAFILTKLFSIGIFLGFINILAEIGTFAYIAGFIELAPSFVVVPVAILITFLVAIPAGGYSVGVSALIMPLLVASNLSVMQLGLAAIAVGLGTQISPAQINVASLSSSFQVDMEDIIKINIPYILGALALLCVVGFFV